MLLIGLFLIVVSAAATLSAAGVTLWGAWLAFRGELLPGWSCVPPGPSSSAPSLVGVVLPLVAVSSLFFYLAVVLLRLGSEAVGV